MSVRRSLIPLALTLFAARCTNGPHPTAVEQPAAPTPHFLRWAGGSAPQFSAVGALASLPGGALRASLSAGLQLDRYIESQLLGLWYREGTNGVWEPIPAVQELAGKSFVSALPHFCEYAISW